MAAGRKLWDTLTAAGEKGVAQARAGWGRWAPVVRGRCEELARKWGPVVAAKSRDTSRKARELGARAAVEARKAGDRALVKSKELADHWGPVARQKGAELAAASRKQAAAAAQATQARGGAFWRVTKRRTHRFWHGMPLWEEGEKLLAESGRADLAQHLKLERALMARPWVEVVVCGEFSAGKSSLINALLGHILLEEDLVPTTGQLTQVFHAEERVMNVRMADGAVRAMVAAELADLTRLDDQGRAREDVVSVEIGLPDPLLAAGLRLVDTPGSGDPGERGGSHTPATTALQAARGAQAFHSADAVIWVVNAERPLKDVELDLMQTLLENRPGLPLLAVLNVVDSKPREELVRLRERVTTLLGQTAFAPHVEMVAGRYGQPFFEINVRAAQDAPEEASAGDFGRLKEALAELGAAGPAGVAPARTARTRLRLEKARRENAALLAEQAVLAKQQETELQMRIHAAEDWQRRFLARAEQAYGEWVSLTRMMLDQRLDSALDDFVRGRNLKQLYNHAKFDISNVLRKSFEELCVLATNMASEVMRQYGLQPARPLKYRTVVLGATVPSPGLASYFSSQAHSRYESEVASVIRQTWVSASESALPGLVKLWHSTINSAAERGKRQMLADANPRQSFGDHVLKMKTAALRLKAGRRNSLGQKLGGGWGGAAYQELSQRAARGEKIKEEHIRHELLESVLAVMTQKLDQSGLP